MIDNTTTTSKSTLIGRLLGSPKPSPAAELRQALDQIEQRRKQIGDRLLLITDDTIQHGAAGPERQRALLQGTPADVARLDEEQRHLLIERDQQLPAQAAELRSRLEQAEAQEARQRLPSTIKALPAMLKAHAAAHQALVEARKKLNDQINSLIVDRRVAGTDSPTVPDELIEQVCEVREWHEPDAPHTYSTNRARIYAQLASKPSPRRAAEATSPGRTARNFADVENERKENVKHFLDPGGAARRKSV